jgi:hypothetical protein
MSQIWNQIVNIPEVIGALSVLGTVLVMVVFYLFKKKVLSFDTLHPTISMITQMIIASAGETNPKEEVTRKVNKLIPADEMALLSKKLSTEDPVQKIYDKITQPAKRAGIEDGSKWVKELGTGLAETGVKALADGLVKKWF